MLPDTPLSVTLRAVVGLTQQLAVAFGGTTLRPRCDMVGIHLRLRPNLGLLLLLFVSVGLVALPTKALRRDRQIPLEPTNPIR